MRKIVKKISQAMKRQQLAVNAEYLQQFDLVWRIAKEEDLFGIEIRHSKLSEQLISTLLLDRGNAERTKRLLETAGFIVIKDDRIRSEYVQYWEISDNAKPAYSESWLESVRPTSPSQQLPHKDMKPAFILHASGYKYDNAAPTHIYRNEDVEDTLFRVYERFFSACGVHEPAKIKPEDIANAYEKLREIVEIDLEETSENTIRLAQTILSNQDMLGEDKKVKVLNYITEAIANVPDIYESLAEVVALELENIGYVHKWSVGDTLMINDASVYHKRRNSSDNKFGELLRGFL